MGLVKVRLQNSYGAQTFANATNMFLFYFISIYVTKSNYALMFAENIGFFFSYPREAVFTYNCMYSSRHYCRWKRQGVDGLLNCVLQLFKARKFINFADLKMKKSPWYSSVQSRPLKYRFTIIIL